MGPCLGRALPRPARPPGFYSLDYNGLRASLAHQVRVHGFSVSFLRSIDCLWHGAANREVAVSLLVCDRSCVGRPPGCGATRPLFGRQLGRLRARLQPGFDPLGIRGWASRSRLASGGPDGASLRLVGLFGRSGAHISRSAARAMS